MFPRFELLDKVNYDKLNELQKEDELTPAEINLIKKAINAAHIRVDHALIKDEELAVEFWIKEGVFKKVDKVLGKEMSKETRSKLQDILTSTTQKICGRYYTSLANGYCSYTGVAFQFFTPPPSKLVKQSSILLLPGFKEKAKSKTLTLLRSR